MKVILNMALFAFFWVLFCLVGDLILGIKTFSGTMAWGGFAIFVSAKLADCITWRQGARVEED